MKTICSCGGFTVKLMPDFSSDGIWCDRCGSGLNGEDLGLPDWLIRNIRDWNNYWDRYLTNNNYKDCKVPKQFNEEGFMLAKEIKKYHPCVLWICEEE